MALLAVVDNTAADTGRGFDIGWVDATFLEFALLQRSDEESMERLFGGGKEESHGTQLFPAFSLPYFPR